MQQFVLKELRFILMLPLFFLSITGAFAQATQVRGKITDENNTGLPGVTVMVKGTNVGTTTDIDGNFSVSAPDGSGTLVVSYVGYRNQEVPINNRATINVTMAPDNKVLDEVVVIGYGAVRRRDLTGSVASIKAEEIVQQPTHNALEAIQGRAPGVDITRSSGNAGAGVDIRIRGNRSIAARGDMARQNSPLFIIDGFQGGNISDINPNDIESIEVLKDASATAIYGWQGANGVIIVTTKRGKEGKARVSYNGFYGINGLTPYQEPRLREDYIQLRREANRNPEGNNNPWVSSDDDARIFEDWEREGIANDQWVDWVDLLRRNGSQQSHAVSMRGGSEKTKAFLSLGYFKEEGLLRNNDMTRYNARLNLDQTISSWAKAGLLSQVTYTNQNNRQDPLSAAISTSPLGIPYDENGLVNWLPVPRNNNLVSPLSDERNENIARNNTLRGNILTNAYFELTPLKGLSFRSSLGTTLNFSRIGVYNDRTSFAQRNDRVNSVSSVNTSFGRFYNWDNVLNYSRDFGGHSFTITGITSYLRSDSDGLTAQGNNQALASQLFYNLGGTNVDGRVIGSPFTRWNNMSYAGRVNYSYKGRYLLTVTQRYDGSSRLAPGNKWDSFPSAAIAWNIAEEAFMSELPKVSLLKMRLGYGVSGNASIAPYGTQSTIIPSNRISFGEQTGLMYLFSPTVQTRTLGWERSATLNFGLDMGFFNDRLSANIDLYRTKTTDILLDRPLPQFTGLGSNPRIYQNIGSTENKGIELGLTTHNIQSTDFTWSTTATFALNREKITGLVNDVDVISDERNSWLIGHPINTFYSFRKLGIWQLDEADEAAKYSMGGRAFRPGDIKLEDQNGDFVIDANNDRLAIGSAVPKWTGGLQNTFRYKFIDLGIFITARWGQMIDAEFLGRFNPSGEGGGNAFIDYWTPENPTNDFPRPRRGANLATINGYQTLTFVDGSYVKLRNVNLGITIPKDWAGKVGASNIRLYATGGNLYTIAKSHLIQNYDPERGGSESGPLNRQLVFGLNLDF